MLLSLLAAGCLSSEQFASSYDRIWCERYEECDLGQFEGVYGDVDTCFLALQSAGQVERECRDQECVFHPDDAQACLDELGGETCDSFVHYEYGDACDAVWDCKQESLDECIADIGA